ncbi:unnamed protein product, partial [marine sediment metagenome]
MIGPRTAKSYDFPYLGAKGITQEKLQLSWLVSAVDL